MTLQHLPRTATVDQAVATLHDQGCAIIDRLVPEETIDRMGVAAEMLQLDTQILMMDLGGLPDAELYESIERETGIGPPVVDAKDVLDDPRGVLVKLCEAFDVPFLKEENREGFESGRALTQRLLQFATDKKKALHKKRDDAARASWINRSLTFWS